ncbi:hypothetical protein HORM4_520119 [Vibrio harveyi]|nr:hypothetical protein HORM4_520119 [Vibrio harveyi]
MIGLGIWIECFLFSPLFEGLSTVEKLSRSHFCNLCLVI